MWWTHWKNVYNYPSLSNVPWYTVLGNHDYGYGAAGVQAQIVQSKTDSDLAETWRTPATNYTLKYVLNENSGAYLAIVCLDTTTLAPSENKCCNSNGYLFLFLFLNT
jgi:hypothetical protein